MRLVVFGLTISSSWANGHATLWRSLAHGLADLGHELHFFERDVHYYAAHRDFTEMPAGALHLYPDWSAVHDEAAAAVAEADAAMVTSYCPDGPRAAELVLTSRVPVSAFYDLDTPITLELLEAGQWPEWLPTRGLRGFDRVLSFTGGAALQALRTRLGACNVATLYGSVDPEVHAPRGPLGPADLSYLGTYAADRQAALERMLLLPARRRRDKDFVVAGSQYPAEIDWPANVYRIEHVRPSDHAAFYRASKLTLSVTRAPMARLGHCPSGRLFEAAACGVPVLTDRWSGLDQFFAPGREIFVADDTADVLGLLEREPDELAEVGNAARQRVLTCHTGWHRAAQLVELLAARDYAVAPLADPFERGGTTP